jgi:hypothetical protein
VVGRRFPELKQDFKQPQKLEAPYDRSLKAERVGLKNF